MATPQDTYVPAYRKLFEPDHHLSMGRPVCPRFAWLDLCQMGTREAREVSWGHELIHLEPKELVVSVRTLAERWRWSKSAVQRFLGTLEKRDSLRTVRGTPAGTVYRVVNAGVYWPGLEDERDTPDAPSGTAEGQEADKNKKLKSDERDNPPTPLDPVARAVVEMLAAHGADWKLKASVEEWAATLKGDYTNVGNIPLEIRRCSEWWQGSRKKLSSPDRAIRNWLGKANDDAGRNDGRAASQGGGQATGTDGQRSRFIIEE